MRLFQRWRNKREARVMLGIAEDIHQSAPDLGMTPEEAETDIAHGRLMALTGAREVQIACERVHGGVAMRAEGKLYWWRDRQLYAVDSGTNPHVLPTVPGEVTAEAVREAIGACCCTSFAIEMGSEAVYGAGGIFRSLFGRRRTGPNYWEPIRRTYQSCETYQHSATAYTHFKHEQREQREEFQTALYFERPDRVAFDGKSSSDQHNEESGWIRAVGPAVRYWSTRDGRELDCFTLQGAFLRATHTFYQEREIPQLLLPEHFGIIPCEHDEREYQREESEPMNGTPCYRLTHSSHYKSRDETGEEETNHSATTYWVDDLRHSILAIKSTLYSDKSRLEWHIDYRPRFNEPIAPEVWAKF
jgi:hypothetical protein